MLDKAYLQNLDGMTGEELVEYAISLEAVQATDDDAIARDKLVRYAQRKAQAMKAREQGTIATALQLEAGCEAIYRSLPAYARW